MGELAVTHLENSTGVALPKEVLARLNIEKGDNRFLTDSPDRYRLAPYNPDFERQMGLVPRVMNERRNVLRELAKGRKFVETGTGRARTSHWRPMMPRWRRSAGRTVCES